MRILLAVDGSKFSEAATRTVIAQARPQEDLVRVLHVIDILPPLFIEQRQYYPGVEHSRDALRRPAEALVAKTAELLRSKDLEVSTVVELGSPKSTIIDTAQDWHADLIVMGSHGRTGLDRFLMGSLPDSILCHAHCSVELVRIPRAAKGLKQKGLGKGKTTRILLATDDSKCSEAALGLLVEQVRPRETEVRVLHVVEPLPLLVARDMGSYEFDLEPFQEARVKQAEELVARFAETLRTKTLKVTAAVVQGDPKSEILDAAQKWNAQLIVLGSLGQSGLKRFLMGSVSIAVARHASCSVEIVRTLPAP